MNKKKTWNLLLRFIGLIILGIILYSIDYHSLKNAILKVDFLLYLFSFVLLFFIYIFKSIRWKILLSIQKISYSFINCLAVFFSSNFIAFITPGRIGEVAKVFYLKRDKDIVLSKAFPSVFLDRLYDVYTLLFLGFIGFSQFSVLDKVNTWNIVFIFLLLILPWFLIIKRIGMPILKMISKLPLLKKHIAKVDQIGEAYFEEMSLFSSVKLIYALFFTVAAYLVLYYLSYLIAVSCGFNISFTTIMFFVSFANIASFLPISISGIGTREASFIFLFNMIGKSNEEAILFSTLFFVTFYIVGGLYGFLFYLYKPISISFLKTS